MMMRIQMDSSIDDSELMLHYYNRYKAGKTVSFLMSGFSVAFRITSCKEQSFPGGMIYWFELEPLR